MSDTKLLLTKDEKISVVTKITNFYRIGLLCFAMPFILAALLIAFRNSFDGANMIPFLLLLVSVLPLSILGLTFVILGIRLSDKIDNIHKKNIGYCNIIVGGIMCLIGLFNWGLIYVMTC